MTHPTDTAKSDKLKPADCPFCCSALSGPHFSDAGVKYWIHPGVITDGECFFSGQGIYAPQLAAWNRRSSPPQNDAGVEGLRQALKEAREALCNYACHAGPGVPCLRDAYQCEQECGKAAGDAIIAIDAALARTPMSALQALGQEFEAGEKDIQQKADTFTGAMFIASADSEGEFVAGDDGYMVYWPKGCHGAFNAWTLRLFADELDRRNADWDRHFNDHNPLPSAPSGGDSDHG